MSNKRTNLRLKCLSKRLAFAARCLFSIKLVWFIDKNHLILILMSELLSEIEKPIILRGWKSTVLNVWIIKAVERISMNFALCSKSSWF